MAKLQYVRGASGNPIWRVFIQDSSSTTGAGLTGLTSASSGLKAFLMRELDAATTNYTAAGSTIETIATLGTYAAPTATKLRFKEIDATNAPGWYEVQAAQAIIGTGDASRFVSGMLSGATNMAPCAFEIQLGGVDIQDGVRGGMSALPAAVPGAANGLFIAGTNAATSITTGLTAHLIGTVDTVTAVTNDVGITQTAADKVWASAARTLTSFGTLVADAATAVWDAATRVLTAGTNIALAKGTGVTGFNDLTSAQVTTAATAATPTAAAVTAAVTVTGDLSATMKASVTAAVPTVAAIAAQVTTDHGAGSYIRNTEPDNTSITAIKAKTDNLPAAPADESLIIAATNALNTKLGTPAGASVSADIAAAKTDTAAIKTKTDNLPASPAAVGSAMTLTTGERTSVADTLLDRDMSAGTDSGSPTVRTPRQALRAARNKVDTTTNPAVIYKEDDTTPSWSTTLTTDPAANPITKSDPA
jgi:hypothetical protein